MRHRIAPENSCCARRRTMCPYPAACARHVLVFLLAVSVLVAGGGVAFAEDLHPEAFAGTVMSRTGDEVELSVEPGVEFGRQEEVLVYQKRDAIQIGGVTVKVNWTRIGKIRIDAVGDAAVKAKIVDEFSDAAIHPGDEIGRLPNTAPRIVSLHIETSRVRPRHEVGMYVKAEDDERDILHYSARANGGRLLCSDDESPVMQWIAPEQPGTYEIAVRVSDEKGGVCTGEIAIEVLSASETDPYMLVYAVGGDTRAPWQFGAVTDIEMDEMDNMWVLDAEKKLLWITSPTGATIGSIDLKHGKSAFGVSPSKVCLAGEERAYVLDSAHRKLDALDRKGKLLKTVFDSSSQGNFLIETPSDMVAIDGGDMLITDSTGGHIVTIDRDGRFVLLFAAGGTGSAGIGTSMFPCWTSTRREPSRFSETIS